MKQGQETYEPIGQLLISSSLNPPLYKSSYHKQGSLITTSKVSYFLFQIQTVKSHAIFTLYQPAITNSTSLHPPLYFNSLRKI